MAPLIDITITIHNNIPLKNLLWNLSCKREDEPCVITDSDTLNATLEAIWTLLKQSKGAKPCQSSS